MTGAGGLLGRTAVTFGEWLPTFRRKVLPSQSASSSPRNRDPEDKGITTLRSIRTGSLPENWTAQRGHCKRFIFRVVAPVHYNLRRITGTLHEDSYIFMIVSRCILLKIGHISDNICRENQNTRFMFRKLFTKIVPFMR